MSFVCPPHSSLPDLISALAFCPFVRSASEHQPSFAAAGMDLLREEPEADVSTATDRLGDVGRRVVRQQQQDVAEVVVGG